MSNKLPLAWNNRYATFFSTIYPVEKLRGRLDLFSDTLYSRGCLDYVSCSKVDAIYSFPWPFDRYVVTWARKLSKPLIIEMWEDYASFAYLTLTSLGLPQSTVAQEVRRYYKWMLDVAEGADRVIVPTRVFANRLQELGVEGNKVRVIPVCVDPSPPSSLQHIKEKHALKDEEKVIFHIGSLAPWHDLSTLMRSIQQVKSKSVFIIAGGRNRELEKQAKRCSPSARVIFTGRLEPSEVGSYLALADICVALYRFPQPSGFFPAKVVRYMLAGRAIVATDTPEIREMFRDKEAGILVPQEDFEALAHALDRLADDSQERLKLGSIAKEIAQNSYQTQHHTEQLTEVFREVM
jgi:glycosyltransferase involved in cell wall biosynthesis